MKKPENFVIVQEQLGVNLKLKVCDDEACLPGVVDVSFEGVIEGEERLRFGDLEPVLKVDDIWNETSMIKSLNIIEVIYTEKNMIKSCS